MPPRIVPPAAAKHAMTGPRPQWPRLFQTFLLAVLIGALQGARRLHSVRELPLGCDEFGYQRQAALFRENGLGGFDTRLETPNSRRLIEIGKATSEVTAQWYQAVAPHCHHYRPEVDRVILQYPPGTGMLMALLPEDVERRWFRFACLFSIAAAFAYLLSRATRPAEGLVVLGGAATVLIASQIGTDSAYVGIALSVICGLLLTPALRAGGAMTPALLGLVAGFSSGIRLTNLLIVAIVGLVFLARLARSRNRRDLAILLSYSLASMVGLAPALWANLVNAGSVFSTTYSPIDATLVGIDLDGLIRGAAFYFGDSVHGRALAVSLVGGVAALLANRRSVAMWVAAAAMALSLAYLLPKDVLIPYYLLPAAAFLIAASLSTLIDGGRSAASGTAATVVFPVGVVAAGVIGLMVAAFPSQRLPVNATVEKQLASDPIVWGDVYGSAVVMRYGAYSAKIMFTSPEIQDALVSGLYEAGIAQFFVVDTDSMAAVADRVRTRWLLTPAGDVFGKPLFRLSGQVGAH
jgi:hypothetical protein